MEVLTGTYKAFVDIANAPQLRDAVSNVDKNFNIFITDLYHSVEEVEKTPGPPPQILALKSRNPWIYLKKLHRMFDFTPWILFTILGILTAITGVFLDFGTIYLFNLRLGFATDDNWFIGFLGFYISGFVLASITTAMGAHITPFCDGSGAPEIKSIMSGANTYRYLEPIVFFPKFIGMCTAYGAGMQVGRAGPLVHMSSIIGCWLLKKEPFKHLDKNLAMKRSILSAACGCGTAVALGAPLTGLIFSVEIVIGFVNTSNVFRTFWAICVGLVSVKAMKFFISVDPLHITQFNYYQLDFDLLSFMFLSLICGLLGVAFLKLALKLIYLRRNIVNPIFERYSWVWLTYTLLAVTHFPFKYALQSTRLFYNDAYSIHELSDNPKLQEPILDFTYYAIIKFITMPFIFSCNIPFGIFGLPLTLGAIVGRLYAEIGQASGLIHPKMKGAYGVVGSAAILATVVRGVFPAAMLIETTGQIEYGIPICVGVLVGYCVGNAFSMSFFDFPIFVRKLPIVASLMTPELYSKNAQQLMDPAYPYIHLDATHKEAFDLITELPEINKALFIPVLDAERHVVGAVKLENLLLYLEQLEEQETARIQGILEHTRKVSMNRHNYDINRWQDIKKFFNKTGTMYEKEEHLEGDSRIVKPSFHMKTFNPKNEDRRVDNEDPVEQFWAKKMDWDSDRIRFDPAPLLVNAQCWASKIQFLFTSTKTACIMVIDAGKYVGCITSQAFLKQKAY